MSQCHSFIASSSNHVLGSLMPVFASTSRDQSRSCQFGEIAERVGGEGLGLLIHHELLKLLDPSVGKEEENSHETMPVIFEQVIAGAGDMVTLTS